MTTKTQKITNLLDRIDNDRIKQGLERQFNSFPRYVLAVYEMQIGTTFAKEMYEGADLRSKISELDRKRRIAHNAAIDACNVINRQCDKFGVPHICTDKTDNRYAVADFVGSFVSDVYFEGINARTMDEIVEHLENSPRAVRYLEEECR